MLEPSRAVFLSYASADAAVAERICAALSAAGVEVWFDRSELRGGDAWDQKIRQQVRSCHLFIPLISRHTQDRPEGYFRLEWKLAVDRSHLMAAERTFILPIVIDDVAEAEALVPEKFREVQWTRLSAGNVPGAFVDRVSLLLSQSAAPSSSPHRRDPSSAASAARPRSRPAARRGVLLGAALLVLLAIGGVAAYRLSARSSAIGLVAVLPFENATGDPSIEYLTDGISESLIDKLSTLGGLRVISRTSAFAFKGSSTAPLEIGRKLGVDALVIGSLAEHGGELSITAELVNVRDATHLWGEKYARRLDDVMQVEGEIAATIAGNLRRHLSGEDKLSLERTATSDPEAYRLYLKGRSFLVGTQQEMDKSIDYFQQAVARAPDYAMAHAGLAEAYTRQAFIRANGREQVLGQARAAVTRALELDPDLAEAHLSLALVRFYFEWDWRGAAAEFRRALALNPGSEAVHEEYAGFLMAMGRLDEALAQSREAARLDPLSVGPVHDMGINFLTRSDFRQAEAEFRRTIDIDPNWTWGYIKLARTLALEKKCQEAFRQSEVAERRIVGGAAPLSRSWLGTNYALCGDRPRAREKLEELHALEKRQYVDPVTFASILGALGEVDEALRYYTQAFADRAPSMVYALIGRRLAPELRDDLRYKSLVDRMNFPQSDSELTAKAGSSR